VILAIGVGVLTNGLVALLHLGTASSLAIGAALVVASFVTLFVRTRPERHVEIMFRGVIAAREPDHARKRLVEVPRYEFSERLRSYIEALCAENAALAKTWGDAHLSAMVLDPATSARALQGRRFIEEGLEYFVLDRLSLHLSSYFTSVNAKDDRLQRFARHDVPDVLLQNRFFETFSRPMDERPGFQQHRESGKERAIWLVTPEGPKKYVRAEVAGAWGSSGEIYSRFSLTLPKGATLRRHGPRSIEIVTTRFRILLEANFAGFSTNLPAQFEELYLGLTPHTISPLEIRLSVKVTFARLALLSPIGWEYYEWLDSFLSDLRESLDFDSFVSRIGWEVALTSALIASRIPAGDTERGERDAQQAVEADGRTSS
jgi:hypothetical protein